MSLKSSLNLSTPIIQAPMAGASNADFVIGACRLGVLGSLGAGMMSPQEINNQINNIKAGTNQAFNLNLMVLDKDLTSRSWCGDDMPDWLCEYYDNLGIGVEFGKSAYDFETQFAVLLTNPVPVASFTFGILSKEQIKALQALGTKVIGTANTVAEVKAWQAVGADAVVVQGVGAGGHQGGWLDENGKKLDTLSLLRLAKQEATLPLIAAGGIANRETVKLMLDNGADLVAVGTAFLTTHESPISPVWKNRLLQATSDETRLTRLYSGKLARGIITDFMTQFADFDNETLPPYPLLNAMTKSLRVYGLQQGNSELMSLWAGVGVGDCCDEPMSDLINRLI